MSVLLISLEPNQRLKPLVYPEVSNNPNFDSAQVSKKKKELTFRLELARQCRHRITYIDI